MAEGKKIKITLVRSVIGRKPEHKRTVKALGLKKLNSSVVKTSCPVIDGMVASITHMVKVEEID